MKIALIAAVALNGVIGKNNKLPWTLKQDLPNFKRVTMGSNVIMGANTFQSILDMLKKPLPGRINIVITRNPSKFKEYDNVLYATSVEKALEIAQSHSPDGTVFVIGGEQIFNATWPRADEFYLTRVMDISIEGDTYFLDWVDGLWREDTKPVEIFNEPGSTHNYSFHHLVRESK